MGNEWKSMDTAPMDGRYIDVFHPSYGVIRNVFYDLYKFEFAGIKPKWKVFIHSHFSKNTINQYNGLGTVEDFDLIDSVEHRQYMMWREKEIEELPISYNVTDAFTLVKYQKDYDDVIREVHAKNMFLVVDGYLMFHPRYIGYVDDVEKDERNSVAPILKNENFGMFTKLLKEVYSEFIVNGKRYIVSKLKAFDIREDGMTIVDEDDTVTEISYKLNGPYTISPILLNFPKVS